MNTLFKVKAKRWVGFLLIALLVCNFIPVGVFATEETPSASKVEYAGGDRYYDAE